jgi:purine catabolism regulator
MLVSRLVGDQGVRELVDRTLGPLEEADDSKNSDLIGTLSAFLACHGNISQAARQLYLNRHSLIYRLRRISEITGLDLESSEDRSLLDMAMRIRKLRLVTMQ